ncbi:alpha/beta fold hydrolase [Streptomyces malaysiensis]|uniref:Alpha/beta hydrolase n=1 Tax=Streptomyces malaysiensis subsp. samsunensis TaxID=459658 RepID=A0A9X2M0J4_STRMQ|nr:alpha/beta hydrolase [Streptomyces samsunensis]MCQ8833122.1 alpha/beta hydrolase [Streptomyces samsunensis]
MVNRRSFWKIVGAGAVGAPFAGLTAGSARAAGVPPEERTPAGRPHTSFAALRQIKAGELNVGYAEAGPAHGPAVVLLHGWPYDIHSYVDVAPLLAAEGYRVVVPYLRGYGTTRFLSPRTFRDAQQSVFALDLLALMDALGIERAILAGYDWGSRTADIVAALWPKRCKALVSVSGYLITNREKNKQPQPPKVEWAWWYQYYFATERGVLGLENAEYRRELARLVWRFNSPTWRFDEATFARTAAAFKNPDYVRIVIRNYRWRLGLAEGDPRYDGLERRLAKGPVIGVPTVTLDGGRDPFTPPGGGAAYRDKFSGPYAHRTLRDIGHNVPQEAPEAFAEAVVEADRLRRR